MSEIFKPAFNALILSSHFKTSFRYYEFQESTITFPTTFDKQIQLFMDHLIDQTLIIDDFSLVDYVLECPCRQYMTDGEPLDIALLENHYRCNSRVFQTRDLFSA